MSILEISNITKLFSGIAALDDVSFAVQEGTIHAVIGPNGSGKTTLFNIISGVYRPTKGEIRLQGNRIDGLRPFEIARKGLNRTFQHPRLFRSMTVLEQLLMASHASGSGWRFSKAKRKMALEKLEFVGLAHLADMAAASLPQGQKRLLEIARALCLEPKLLLLDEPYAGLNPVESEQLMELIRTLNGQGMTILLVEHEMRVVMSLAKQISVLNFGKLIAVGKPEEIQQNQAVIEAYLGSYERGNKYA